MGRGVWNGGARSATWGLLSSHVGRAVMGGGAGESHSRPSGWRRSAQSAEEASRSEICPPAGGPGFLVLSEQG